jgi:hypothetical protein
MGPKIGQDRFARAAVKPGRLRLRFLPLTYYG